MWWSLRKRGKHFRPNTEREAMWLAAAPEAWWLAATFVVVGAGFLRKVDEAILVIPHVTP